MEVIIQRTNNTDEIFDRNRIIWKLFVQKRIKQILIIGLFGLFVIGYQLAFEKTEDFWGFFSSLGMGFIFLSLFYFIHTYQYKSRFFDRVKQFIDYYKNRTEGIEIKITDEFVTYRDFEAYCELKWTNFKQYKIFKGHLLLVMDSNYLTSVAININSINPEEFPELIDFLKSKIPEGK